MKETEMNNEAHNPAVLRQYHFMALIFVAGAAVGACLALLALNIATKTVVTIWAAALPIAIQSLVAIVMWFRFKKRDCLTL